MLFRSRLSYHFRTADKRVMDTEDDETHHQTRRYGCELFLPRHSVTDTKTLQSDLRPRNYTVDSFDVLRYQSVESPQLSSFCFQATSPVYCVGIRSICLTSKRLQAEVKRGPNAYRARVYWKIRRSVLDSLLPLFPFLPLPLVRLMVPAVFWLRLSSMPLFCADIIWADRFERISCSCLFYENHWKEHTVSVSLLATCRNNPHAVASAPHIA